MLGVSCLLVVTYLLLSSIFTVGRELYKDNPLYTRLYLFAMMIICSIFLYVAILEAEEYAIEKGYISIEEPKGLVE